MGKRIGTYTVLEDPVVDGRKILKWILKKWVGDKDWINLAQKRDSLQAVVNGVVNFWFPYIAGNFLSS